ncbi:OLC1v1017218C1 [Oldenlandia corymbosa var. corymbosa]|uniref:OLC1v1017218C1 n=1 Tax=Oldenlandia corymbosa var. corymbosa TaxID=529605 RepID=A0AAV1E936_OLDCO|nr:OLC1v1017218C1 [Oldenlandia corymbosa var. corymbosa]
MGEKSKKPRKNYVSEVDIATLLQRYNATTVLTLLQEVAQVQDYRIDWDFLAKKTTTGISNPREYQMIWRHLAYRDTLLDKVDNVTQPLDDDSDLECELEAFPAVSSDALAEAAACVKVLIASGGPSDPTGSTMEAPLTINIPKSQMSNAPDSLHSNAFALGTNITVPISVQKQSITSASSSEVVDSTSAANANLPRRKRKPWSTAEDMELIAAVQKCGEGNWANILKSDFKGDRTASQLSQRWAIIRKRKVKQTVASSSQHAEAQIAANRAVNLALQDVVKSPPSIMSGTNGNSGQSTAAETSSAFTAKAAAQPDVVVAGQQSGLSKSRGAAPKKPTTKATLSPDSKLKAAAATKATISPDSMLKAAAFAAGARIATGSDAATLLKAAQSKNAHHIKPGVHFFRTGMGPKPLSAHSSSPGNPQAGGIQQVPGPTKMATPIIQPILAATAPGSTTAAQVKSATIPLSTSKVDGKAEEDSTSISTASTVKEQLVEHQAGVQLRRPNVQTKGEETSSPGTVLKDAPQDQGNLGTSIRDQLEGGQTLVLVKPSEEPTSGDKVSATADALIQPAQEGFSDAPSFDVAGSNGHVGQEATTKSEGTSKDNVEHASVEETFDNNEEISEIKNTTLNEEDPVPMDIDGNAGLKNVKEPEVQNGLPA